MNYTALLTGLARLFVIYPLICFFWAQARFHARNGHVGIVRRATVLLSFFLILMFGNLVYVNFRTAINNVPVSDVAQWISLISSVGFAWASWRMYRIFKQIQ